MSMIEELMEKQAIYAAKICLQDVRDHFDHKARMLPHGEGLSSHELTLLEFVERVLEMMKESDV